VGNFVLSISLPASLRGWQPPAKAADRRPRDRLCAAPARRSSPRRAL